jgi:hypothetical protein
MSLIQIAGLLSLPVTIEAGDVPGGFSFPIFWTRGLPFSRVAEIVFRARADRTEPTSFRMSTAIPENPLDRPFENSNNSVDPARQYISDYTA